MPDLTESQFGFVGEVLYDEQKQPFLRSDTVTNIGWKEEMRSLYERYITTGLDFRNNLGDEMVACVALRTVRVAMTRRWSRRSGRSSAPRG